MWARGWPIEKRTDAAERGADRVQSGDYGFKKEILQPNLCYLVHCIYSLSGKIVLILDSLYRVYRLSGAAKSRAFSRR